MIVTECSVLKDLQAHNLRVASSNLAPATNPLILLFFLDTPLDTRFFKVFLIIKLISVNALLMV